MLNRVVSATYEVATGEVNVVHLEVTMTRARTRRVALIGLATALLAFIIPTTASTAAAKPRVVPSLQTVSPTMSASTWGPNE